MYFSVRPSTGLGQHEQMSVHSATRHHFNINDHCEDAVLARKLGCKDNPGNAPGTTSRHSSPLVPGDGDEAQQKPSRTNRGEFLHSWFHHSSCLFDSVSAVPHRHLPEQADYRMSRSCSGCVTWVTLASKFSSENSIFAFIVYVVKW